MLRGRHLIKAMLSPLTLRVRSGPLSGLRWVAASGIRFVRGDFETFKTDALLEVLRPGDVVFDVGAHVGYYTVISALRVGPRGLVAAFEPRPVNARYLRRHLRLNRIENVRFYESAVGAARGEARFDTRTGTGTGHLAPEGDLPVSVLRLDDLVEAGELPPPSVLKIDVEGGELDVLHGAMQLLRAHRPTLLLATHGDDLHRECLALLRQLGYEWRILDPGILSGDIEILARFSATSDA